MAYSASKAKGSRAETVVRDRLRKYSGLNFERTPLSGALDAKHQLSGDVYIPGDRNTYCIEVKHYKDTHISHLLLSDAVPMVSKWWAQTVREGIENKSIPLLIFKHDRSKLYVAVEPIPECIPRIDVIRPEAEFSIALLDDWLIQDCPVFNQ